MSIIYRSNHSSGVPSVDTPLDFVLILDTDFAPVAIDSPGTDSINAVLILDTDFAPIARDHYVDDTIDAAIVLNSDFAPVAEFPSGIDAALILYCDFAAEARLRLAEPDPIITELPAGAFQNKKQIGRLKINDTVTKFIRATYSKPKGAAGSEFNVELSRTQLTLIPSDAVIKFEVGTWSFVSNQYVWKTLLDSGKVTGKSLRRAWSADSLAFSSIEGFGNKLSLCPRASLIVYDGNKTQVSVDEVEPIPVVGGGSVLTTKRNIPGLNLHQLLEIAFVEGCGFTGPVETDIPNYEVSRCDFPSGTSYMRAVAGQLGNFKAKFIPLPGNRLRILNRVRTTPLSITPAATLTPNEYPSFQISENIELIDGFDIQYLSNQNGDYSTTRLAQPPDIPSGNFGDPNYTRTEINQMWRDWFDGQDNKIKSELISETRTTYNNNENIVGRNKQDRTFDIQGKETFSKATIEAYMPRLNGISGSTLQTIKDIEKNYLYTTDPYNPSKIIPDKILTRESGIITIDSDNKYLDENFRQSFLKAHKAGNLRKEMTTDYGPIESTVETFTPLGNGQVKVDITGTDHVRDAPLEPVSETRSGDVSISGRVSKIQTKRIYRAGVDPNATKGGEIPTLAGNEIPLFFLLPLAEKLLEQSINPPLAGQVEMTGFDENLERGTYFAVSGRSGENFGNFLAEGFTATFEPLKITTTIDVEQV